MYTIEKVIDRVYCLKFEKQYDLAMHFLRYQEWQESPLFRKQVFPLLEFMKWYAEKYGKGSFSYTKDWKGFNIAGRAIMEVHKAGIPDPNKYDQTMLDIYTQISNSLGDDNFYLIGIFKTKKDKNLLDHEIAHGLYNTNAGYQAEMRFAMAGLKKKVVEQIYKVLESWGYHHDVWMDEMQAYLATGLEEELNVSKIKRIREPFKKIYKKYKRSSK